MSEPYGFYNQPEGPDGYPGDAVIDAANEAADLRAENERLRADLRELLDHAEEHRVSWEHHGHACYEEWCVLRDHIRASLAGGES